MKIILRTNIDRYTGAFPNDFIEAPLIGDMVSIHSGLISSFRHKKLPISLEVKSRLWRDKDTLECELHYNELDLRIAKAAGAEVF